MTAIIFIIFALYIGYIIFERLYHKHLRKSFKKVIHVNGIRGKSTVTRLIDAGLRGCGFSVFSKTTGTLPMTIDTSFNESLVKRLGNANVREQLRLIRWAQKQNAEMLVAECMAVNPELQRISQELMLNADINVITNVRYDHLDEMGETLEGIATSLSNTIPKNGVLVLGEAEFLHIFKERADKLNCKIVVAEPYEGDLMDTFAENIATALAVCSVLGLDRQQFLEGMKKYHHDVGALSEHRVGETLFVNGFSANDPQSIKKMYDQLCLRYDPKDITILLNSRADRVFRVNQHIELVGSLKCKSVIIMGAYLKHIQRRLEAIGQKVRYIKKYDELLQEQVIFGCGNFACHGKAIIDFFIDREERIGV